MEIKEVHIAHAINTLIVFCMCASAITGFADALAMLLCAFFVAFLLDLFLFPIQAPLLVIAFMICKSRKQRNAAAQP